VSAEEGAWSELKQLGEAVVPYLAEGYGRMRRSRGRVSCVFHAIRYARTSEAAFQLGIAALKDKATLVRYRACGLLAYSLRHEAVPALRALFEHTDRRTADDARAAVDAIERRNHHYFIDRIHSGRTFWKVNADDGSG